jgi:hypothetical protein
MIETRTERIMRKKGNIPVASDYMAKNVSQYRRAMLEEEVAQGKFREKGNTGFASPYDFDGTSRTQAGNVIGSMRKFASTYNMGGTGAGSGSWMGGGGSVRQIPEVYSPLWLNSNLNLPRDRATINAWARAFFALNPIVQNAITLHSTYPISKLSITCKDPKIQQFFEDMIEETGLMNICSQIAQEFWVLGEAFPYAELDEGSGRWSRIILQNPDYVVVKHSVVAGEPILSLRPDENLKRIVTSNRPSDMQQRQRLDRSIIEHVQRNENIPLSNFYASHIARKLNPYEVRGTSLIVSCFRNLMLYDKLRESKFAQADNMINPLTLVKIGGAGENFKPSAADLEEYRRVFEDAQYDKDFKIFTHDAVTVERIGYNAGIIDISPDIEKLTKEIYMGLMAPQVLMDGGGDVTYANGGITLDVLKQRYLQFRNMLSAWLRTKIFAPISKINEFYEFKDNKKVLVVPEVEWNHMSLFDAGDYINSLMQMRSANQEAPEVSKQTIYRSLGLDFEDESRKLREEAINDAILAKEKEALQGYSLNELRTLSPDDAIDFQDEEPVPGEESGEEGGEGGGDEMDLGLPGGPPGLGGGPPGGGGGDEGGGGEAAPPAEAGPPPGLPEGPPV